MAHSTLTSKGQVTIPAELRKSLGLEAGTRVVFHAMADGTVVMRVKNKTLLDARGMLKHLAAKRPKVTIEDMKV
jgi:antitoxin PrlF